MKFPGNIVTSCAAGIAGSLNSLCPAPDAIQNGQRFHTDMTCDRQAQNDYKTKLNRRMRYLSLKESGGVMSVPDQKTSVCPVNDNTALASPPTPAENTGLDTVWIVENTASTPVVISYVNEQGVEVSAKNPSISPPESDPDAILQPNQWMGVNTFEGHVFLARELDENGNAGDVLLQHTVGLIPVGAHLADQIMDCPLEDPEPLIENARDPDFARTVAPPIRPCHVMDIGFRNAAGCPLHGYYVSVSNNNIGEEQQENTLTCTEEFKFHLGTNAATPDFMWDWASPTKYEGTFVGHTFNFRLAHDPSVLVQRITLEPTRIMDCPNRKKKVAVSIGEDGIIVPVQGQERINEQENGAQLSETDAAATSRTAATLMAAGGGSG